MDPLISIAEALSRLSAQVHRMDAERMPLSAAHGRILAGDIDAVFDSPAFDRAMLDGYAVRAQDIRSAAREHPVVLTVVGTVPAGSVPEIDVTAGTAVRTMTGAALSAGADAIVRQEYTEELMEQGVRRVKIMRAVGRLEAVQERGYDARRGMRLLSAGTRLGPAELALAAAHGYAAVTVRRRVEVGVMATGSEVTEVGQPLLAGHLYNSNTPMLCAIAADAGAAPTALPPAPDREDALCDRFAAALRTCDVLVTTGGVSVGDYDLTPRALERVGVKRLFWGVWMRPGTPVYAGVHGDRLVLALSGNPTAAFVNAHVLLTPTLRAMAGFTAPQPWDNIKAFLRHAPVKTPVKHTRFLHGRLAVEEGQLWIDAGGKQSAASVGSLTGKTGLARIDPEEAMVDGTLVNVIFT
ncbi:MAG: molybdopterin molybdotransferase MoeA [Bacilli bacterium]